ncbi:MAG: MFS transporter [Erysipelothrix sp.]
MKLNTKRTVLIGLAFMSISAFWQLYDFLIPLILTNTFGVSDTIAGFVMSLDNVLALFMLPFFGALSDKVDTKYGKRMPFIVIGTFVSVVSLIIIPFAANEKILWLFVIGLLVVLIAMSTYRSPAVALMPDVTPKPMRSKGNAIINLMGAVGGMIALLMLNFLSPQKFSGNQYPIFIGIAIFMAVSIIIMILFVRENRWRKEMVSVSEHVHAEEELVTETGEMKADVKSSLTYILISISLWFMGYNAVICLRAKHLIFYLLQTSRLLYALFQLVS